MVLVINLSKVIANRQFWFSLFSKTWLHFFGHSVYLKLYFEQSWQICWQYNTPEVCQKSYKSMEAFRQQNKMSHVFGSPCRFERLVDTSEFQLVQLDLTQCSHLAWIFYRFLWSTCCRVTKAVTVTLCFLIYMHTWVGFYIGRDVEYGRDTDAFSV